MPDNRRFHVDGARVLADLNTLRGIGTYKTGVHKPTFSEPHMRSLAWLAQQLPEAGLAAAIDGIGNVLGTSAKSGPKLLAGSHLESQNYAGWLDGPLGVVYALEARRAMEHVAPEWFATSAVRHIDEYTSRLRRILQRIAPRPWDASIVLLTPG